MGRVGSRVVGVDVSARGRRVERRRDFILKD
jgi:hypothetical protein